MENPIVKKIAESEAAQNAMEQAEGKVNGLADMAQDRIEDAMTD